MAELSKKYDCGIIIPEITSEAISNAIGRLKNNPDLLNKLKMNSVNASDDLSWEKESEKAKKFYEAIFKENSLLVLFYGIWSDWRIPLLEIYRMSVRYLPH